MILLPAMAGGERTRRRRCFRRSGRRRSSSSAPRAARRIRLYAKLEGQNPTGSTRRPHRSLDGRGGRGRRGARAGASSSSRRAATRESRSRWQNSRAIRSRASCPRTRRPSGSSSSSSTAPGSSSRRLRRGNGAIRLALRLAEEDARRFMLNQYANEANPRAHYEGTGAEIAEALPHVDALVAGLGTGGTLMGAGDRLRESFPTSSRAAAEPLQGDLVYGLRSLADGYVPPSTSDASIARSSSRTRSRSPASAPSSTGRASSPACLLRRRAPRRPPARRRARRGRHRLRPRRRRLEVPLRRVLDARCAVHGGPHLVVIPAEVRAALIAHAEEEKPNEACGLIRSTRSHRRPSAAVTRREPLPIRPRGRSPPGSSRTRATSSRSSIRTSRAPRGRLGRTSRTSASGRVGHT